MDGEPELLHIVLEQLLSNAWKFTRHRSTAKIEMGAAHADGHAGFFVRDNGSGFAAEFAGTLFRPFERIHDDATVEGRGIGLAIAHRIVTRHGGRIRAEGTIGHGATFSVLLPRSGS
jgi:signal transduction histidine kinase